MRRLPHRRAPLERACVVLWGGRGLYAVAAERETNGRIAVDLLALEGQIDALDVEAWHVMPVPVPRPADAALARELVSKHRRKRATP